MADRSSAGLIGDMMRYLARGKPTPANRKLAKWLYRKARHYDFSDCQMEADAALVKLGLAKRCTKHRSMVLYHAADECDECQYDAEEADREDDEPAAPEPPRRSVEEIVMSATRRPRITDDVAGRWSW